MNSRPRGRGRGAIRPSASPFAWASTPPTTSTTSSISRRVIVPNFAAAGRLVEPKAEPKTEITSPAGKEANTSKSNHVNNRGHNRGRGRPKAKGTLQREEQRIIKSEGVFSQGFGDADVSGKRSKLKNIKGDETVVGHLENSINCVGRDFKTEIEDKKEVLKRAPKRENGTLNAYEEHWQSDEEVDKEELDELFRDGFISNLKKCSKMPFVLPSKDEAQFRKLVNKKERREEHMDELMESERKDTQLVNKTHEAKFFAAGDLLQHAISGEGANSIMFFQLPPTSLRTVSADSLQPDQLSQTVTASNPPNLTKTQRHCLDGMPTGVQIGKLQFYRSGRVMMNIGGQQMDIAEAIQSNCYEALLRIETESLSQPSASLPTTSLTGTQHKRQFPELNSGAPFVNPSTAFARPSNRIANNAQLLGEVSGQFVCLFDVQRSSIDNGYC
uniref:Uncharacterized protein n=1 Tax=Globodera rostochiensis TaxID=31243 RepID=A0A914I9H1_GLORO